MDKAKNLDFQETLLSNPVNQGKDLCFTIEHFRSGDEGATVSAKITGIEKVMQNGSLVDTFVMDTNEAEVLRLSQEDGEIELVLVWLHYPPDAGIPQIYRLIGDGIRMEIED